MCLARRDLGTELFILKLPYVYQGNFKARICFAKLRTFGAHDHILYITTNKERLRQA